MSEHKWSLLSLAASVALAGLAVIFSQSIPYAAVLIGIAIVLVIGTAAWSAWESFPRILTDTDLAKDAACLIYRRAATKGGIIHATHIFPFDRQPENDLAIQELGRAGSDIDIAFHRILLLDSLEDERTWLRLLFENLRGNVAKRFYTLSSYPLLLPRIAKAVLPRLNLILYQSPSSRSCQVLVGLDRLHPAGVSVNFALHSRSKRVHAALLRYFERITGGTHFRVCNSLQEYDASQPVSTVVQRGQAVVSRAVEFAETTRGVAFVGLFGSMARAALGLVDDVGAEDTDADVDLLIVFDPRSYLGTEQELRRNLESALDEARTKVTWGPDLSVFYPFRDAKPVYVDIECHAVGSRFYEDNRLLGNSIFRYFMPVYSLDQQPVVSYLKVPIESLTAEERWHLLMTDRQGIAYFNARLSESSPDTDPRRLISHVFRNLVWATTGTWPTTGGEAWRHLSGRAPWKEQEELNEARRVQALSAEQVRGDLAGGHNVVRNLIACVMKNARTTEASEAS